MTALGHFRQIGTLSRSQHVRFAPESGRWTTARIRRVITLMDHQQPIAPASVCASPLPCPLPTLWRLEERYGARLIERSTRGFRVTHGCTSSSRRGARRSPEWRRGHLGKSREYFRWPVGIRLGHSAMSAQCPVCPKADKAGRFMSTGPSNRASSSSATPSAATSLSMSRLYVVRRIRGGLFH